MQNIISVNNHKPQLGENCFIAPNAFIIGDVKSRDYCSFWFNSVVRGDVNSIRLGSHVNVQDGAILHCTYKKHDLIIGDYVSIGHNATVHGCNIENHVLIGMGSIIMDGTKIHSNSIIAAGAVVLENTIINSGEIFAGVPAKKVKSQNPEILFKKIDQLGNNYVKYSQWFEK